jgi:hypothetical protein
MYGSDGNGEGFHQLFKRVSCTTLPAGASSYTLDLSVWHPGFYFLHLPNESERFTAKFIVGDALTGSGAEKVGAACSED